MPARRADSFEQIALDHFEPGNFRSTYLPILPLALNLVSTAVSVETSVDPVTARTLTIATTVGSVDATMQARDWQAIADFVAFIDF